MEVINGYNEAEVIKAGSSNVLPKGAYQMKILGVHLNQGNSGRYLEFDLDVDEGEYKGFFDKIFTESTAENKTWRCRYFLSIPTGSGNDKDMYKVRLFKTFISHIEESNPGYTWAWKEDTLANKRIGGLFVNNEYIGKDGHVHTSTIMSKTCAIQDVIDGTFVMPKDKTLPSALDTFTEANAAELPFD